MVNSVERVNRSMLLRSMWLVWRGEQGYAVKGVERE